MIDNSKIILNSLPIPEDDDDFFTDDILEKNFIVYDCQELIDSVGTSEFKSFYLNVIDDIKKLDIKKQKDLCRQLLSKTREIYKFDFFNTTTFDSMDEIESFYPFIEFIEFDNVEFVTEVIKIFNIDVKTFNLSKIENIDIINNILIPDNLFIKILISTIDVETFKILLIDMYDKNKQEIDNNINLLNLWK